MIKQKFFYEEGAETILSGAGGTPAATPPPAAAQGTPAPVAPTEVVLPDNWKEALGDEFKAEPSLAHITDLKTLAKSYVNAQRLVGKDKIVLPGKHATEDDWRAVYNKLGLPEKIEEYKVELGADSTFDATFLKEFTKEAYSNNVLPQQAERLLKWYGSRVQEMTKKHGEEQRAAMEESMQSLKREWGEGFGKQVATARLALTEYGDEGLSKLMDAGLGNEPSVIKFLAKVGSTLAEDKLVDAGIQTMRVTPDEAQKQVNGILADFSGPYYDKAHPNHNNAVAEVNRLYRHIYPEEKK